MKNIKKKLNEIKNMSSTIKLGPQFKENYFPWGKMKDNIQTKGKNNNKNI